MKTRMFVAGLLALGMSIPIVSPSAPSRKTGKAPTAPPKVTPVDCKLILNFGGYGDRTCGLVPTSAANPAYVDGAPTLAPVTSYTYYCKITVEPNAPASSYDAKTFKAVWIKKGGTLNIKVPKECSAKITVEFYEDCNSCTINRRGRPTFRYTDIINKGQPNVVAFLQYIGTIGC